jgi:orotidine-5'-phosphate decarboxylase
VQLPARRSDLFVSLSETQEASRSPIALALDVPTLEGARALAARVAPSIGMVKIGLELFTLAGPSAVKIGEELRLPVFLDLKLHDIPETVGRAVGRACDLGVRLLTIHASGGPRMIARAAERAEKSGTNLTILAVTVLTSSDDADVEAIGFTGGAQATALRLSKMAHGAGARGFVCSAEEVLGLRDALGPAVTLVTPGIRSSSDAHGDQKRVASARDAIARGADWLVVGRPIRDAADPAIAARDLAAEALAAHHARVARHAP